MPHLSKSRFSGPPWSLVALDLYFIIDFRNVFTFCERGNPFVSVVKKLSILILSIVCSNYIVPFCILHVGLYFGAHLMNFIAAVAFVFDVYCPGFSDVAKNSESLCLADTCSSVILIV
jgi:hypothetical protein